MPSDPNLRLAQILDRGVDFESRAIYINGDIDSKALNFIPALHIMDSSPGMIRVFINSPGGDSEVGIALYDALRATLNDVVTINVSKAFSIAALIMQGGDTRLALPNARLMIHNGYMVTDGAAGMDNEDIADMAEESERADNAYHKILAKHTKQPLKKIRDWCKSDTFFDANECLKYGFIDTVVTSAYAKPLRIKK